MSEARYTTYMTDKAGPLPYCPGCGHEALVKALDGALVKLQPDPKDVVIVTDIGCIGLSDRHFATSAFHGLHGRSITYAFAKTDATDWREPITAAAADMKQQIAAIIG